LVLPRGLVVFVRSQADPEDWTCNGCAFDSCLLPRLTGCIPTSGPRLHIGGSTGNLRVLSDMRRALPRRPDGFAALVWSPRWTRKPRHRRLPC